MVERLREVSKAESVGALAGGIARDVSELLNAIVANTSLVLGALPTSNPNCELLARIASASEKAAGLTGQLAAWEVVATPRRSGFPA